MHIFIREGSINNKATSTALSPTSDICMTRGLYRFCISHQSLKAPADEHGHRDWKREKYIQTNLAGTAAFSEKLWAI